MLKFADKVILFNETLDFKDSLPVNVSVMNPFKENLETLEISNLFYKKFYSDNNSRIMILGINPGRFGAGLTGIPFTDPKKLNEKCGIEYKGDIKHEPSSAFIYEMIDAYGGVEDFYKKFYINSVCPLGFTLKSNNGKKVNYNYYDSNELYVAMKNFIVESIRKQIEFGINTEVCFCLGTGKNYKFFSKLNKEFEFFKKIIPLEHPRYVMQYKAKTKKNYIDKYINKLNEQQ